MWEPPTDHPLRRLFAGLTEHAFMTSLGVADPPLIDYMSNLLSRFIHIDTHHRLTDSQGQPLTELTAMAAEADKLPPEGRTRREYQKHVGDFALFWFGLFSDVINRRAARHQLTPYAWLGKRAYRLASEYEDDRLEVETRVLRRLGDDFELCAYGLSEVRREWEELALHPHPPTTGLIR
jgi:hypothetical protein